MVPGHGGCPRPPRSRPRWADVNRLIHASYESAGRTDAAELTAGFRTVFLDPAHWRVFDDTVPALQALSSAGWRHVLVSNHVPELEGLVADLGLATHFDAVVTSALVGYEKPHPEIFRVATALTGTGRTVMVGDNPVADIEGARSASLEAHLVRRTDDRYPSHPDLASLTASLVDRPGEN